MDVAGADPGGHLAGVGEVAGLDVARQAVGGVVGDPDRFLLGLVGEDGEHGAEDLLAGDRHVVADAAEDGGTDVVAAAHALGAIRAAGDELGALFHALGDQGLDLVVLDLADDRADGDALLSRRADDGRFGGGLGDFQGAGVSGRGHQHPGRCVAGLAAVEEALPGAGLDRPVDVGVFEHDVRRLAAELLGHALDRVGGGLGHRAAGAGGAGERHHVDPGVGRHRGADLGALAVDQVEDAGRDARVVQDLGEQDRVQRGDLTRLEHHRAARGERRGDLAGDLVDRPVPGRDQAADADRFLDDVGRAACLDELVVLEHGESAGEVAHARRRLRGLREPGRRAHLRGDGLGHLTDPRLVAGDDPAEKLGPLLAAGLGERLEGGLRRGHGAVDVGRAAEADPADRLFRRRVDHVHGLRRDRVDPLSVDVELQRFLHGTCLRVCCFPGPVSVARMRG